MAGSRVSGPYGVTRAACQPSAGVHSTVNMWSVKWVPKPGLPRISARRSSATGLGREGGADLHGRHVSPPSWKSRGHWNPAGGGLLSTVVAGNASATRRIARQPATGGGASLGHPGGDRVADLRGTPGGPGYSGGQVGGDGRVDGRGRGGVAEVVEQQRRRRGSRRSGRRSCCPAMSGAEPCTGSNIEGVVRSGLMLPRRREADAAGDGAGEVGDDVAEEVVGDDHVEARRVGGQEDRRRVDVEVVDGHVGELRRDRVDDPRPQRAGVHQHVGLVDQRQLPAGPPGRAGEGVAHDALDAVRRVQADLGGDLGRRAGAQPTAVAGVGTLGALADHDEVDVAGVGQRRGDTRGRSATAAG